MDWLLPFGSIEPCPTTVGLPRRLLRHLVRIGQISIGSKVLDAGCGPGDLTRFLDEMAVDAWGFDHSPESIAQAASAARHLTYACGRASLAMPFPEHSFDVVLARDIPEHRGDLSDHAALRATANLLAMVRPLGCLILTSRLEPRWSTQPGGHLETCFQQHLECFPGSRRVSYMVNSFADATNWKWMLGRQPRAGFITAALKISHHRRTCHEWEQLADLAASNHNRICCDWTRRSSEPEERTAIAA